jgi:UDP-N-acetylenolpyruvoylglucosamine reductase
VSVTFKLTKQHQFNVKYGAIAQQLELMQNKSLSIKAISDAVIAIRKSKLPNPEEIGNAGSFFKTQRFQNSITKSYWLYTPTVLDTRCPITK